jgi:predicted RNase H-like HicB family nuclease
MRQTLSYPLRVVREAADGGYFAYFPDLLGCQSWGDSYEEAIVNAEEALAVFIETLIANGDPLPVASDIDSAAALSLIVRSPVAA